MQGTPLSSSSSLASTTFTNPTGTPITAAGRRLPSETSSQRRMSAVGALPTAKRSGPGRGLVHRRDGAGRAVFLCPGGHVRVGHEAADLPAEPGEGGLVDPRARHLRVGHDGRARAQRGARRLHNAGRKDEAFRVIEVGGRVDDPLDDGGRLLRKHDPPPLQLRRDDLEAAPLDVGGQQMFQFSFHGVSHSSIPSRAGIPRSKGCFRFWISET